MIDELMSEAFQLFEDAEMKVDNKLSESIILFRQAVSNLLSAYLFIKGVEGHGGLAELFHECGKINPEFETIQAEVEYLISAVPKEVDGEELTDKANEIWDFIEGLLIVNELELNNI